MKLDHLLKPHSMLWSPTLKMALTMKAGILYSQYPGQKKWQEFPVHLITDDLLATDWQPIYDDPDVQSDLP